MSSGGGDDRRPVLSASRAAADMRRRGKKTKRDLKSSSSYLAMRNSWGWGSTDGQERRRRRSPSHARRNRSFADFIDPFIRSPSPRRRRARSNSYRSEDDEDESELRSPRRSLSPRRRRRARSDSYSDSDDEPARRSRSPSPKRRRRARSNSYLEEEEPDRRRSPSPRRRDAPRSCRSRSRTRSQECEDTRCCVPANDERDMSPDDQADYFNVRIDRPDHLFKCALCNDLLSSPVYECIAGHVTCGSCHDSANGGEAAEHRCPKPQCGTASHGPSRAIANYLSSVRFACANDQYGCPAFLPWREMDTVTEHELTCRYAPVFCPVPRCGGGDYFDGGPVDELERHLTERHGWNVVGFRYGEAFRVTVDDPPAVLRAEDGKLFHLRAEQDRGGTTLSMTRIRPDGGAAAEAEFTYEVTAAGPRHRMQMQSTVLGTSMAYGMEYENPVRVTVPDNMIPVDGPGQDSVEVCVRQVVAAAAAAARDN